MQYDLRGYLFDVVRYCRIIHDFTTGISLAEYDQNTMVRLAVERAFIIIGEALISADKLSAETRQRLQALPKVIGFRNVLVHEYLTIKNDEVWMIVRSFAPALQQQAETWLAELELGDEQ